MAAIPGASKPPAMVDTAWSGLPSTTGGESCTTIDERRAGAVRNRYKLREGLLLETLHFGPSARYVRWTPPKCR